MYVSASWSVVHAVDVRNGKRLWTYDPDVPREAGYKGCCDVVNRGVAVYKGKVYVATYDGRLVALDARDRPRPCGPRTPSSTARARTAITGAPPRLQGTRSSSATAAPSTRARLCHQPTTRPPGASVALVHRAG
jgi:quinohemoprotein ethanol dehydrogenase